MLSKSELACNRYLNEKEPNNEEPTPDSFETSGIRVDNPAPGFVARQIICGSKQGIITLDDFIGKTSLVLFFCPVDLNFVVPQEILAFSDQSKRFSKQGCEVIVLSSDSEIRLKALTRTSRYRGGLGELELTLAHDKHGKIARRYGCINSSLEPLRGIFYIDSSGIIRRFAVDTMPVGWPIVEETLKLIECSFGRDLKISVNKPFRVCTFLDVKSSDTVDSVKNEVGATSKGWSSLFFNGRRLRESATLAECGVHNGAALTLVETSDVMICVAFPPPNGVDVVWSAASETVESFKRTIERLRGYPIAHQKLYYAGREMKDVNSTLADYGIATESLINVTLCRNDAPNSVGKTLTIRS